MNEDLAKIFKALSDNNRLILLKRIADGENCGCTLINKLDITQPTMTYHLNILEDAGLITSKKEGTWRKMSLNENTIKLVTEYLMSIT